MLFADVDAVIASGGVGAAVLTGVGILVKYLLGERETQRVHEREMLVRQEAMAERTNLTFRELHKEVRKESRDVMNTLLTIQKESTEATISLSNQVHNLSGAITEMRQELSKKVDKSEG